MSFAVGFCGDHCRYPDLWGFCGAATRLSVDAETVGGLGEGEEPAGAESAGVAGQVVAAAQLRHDPAGERLVFAGAAVRAYLPHDGRMPRWRDLAADSADTLTFPCKTDT